ncbi:putative nuclease HARBI1 [Prorops nasuta]|uniref:putative nuclease HARBI1 n=1 Tax=Prorops nasuta TaxID=863751 RepID=UPI0034CE776D
MEPYELAKRKLNIINILKTITNKEMDISSASSSEEEVEIRIGLPKRYIRDPQNPFQIFNDLAFRKRYRFTKEAVLYVLLPIVKNSVEDNTNSRGLPISTTEKLLIALRYYGSNCFQNISGDLRKISQQIVSDIVKEISIIFAEVVDKFIYFPRNNDDKIRNMDEFYNIASFPYISGTIDCTHIAIKNPGNVYGEVFRNRKGWFSLNVQVVCGSQLNIMDIVIRHPGSAHDALIFDRSTVRARFENDELDGILLGDAAYGSRRFLLTPVTNVTTAAEINYNKAHISTRNTVERLFGVLKKKFPCLQSGLRTGLSTSAATIAACAVLYNIGVKLN